MEPAPPAPHALAFLHHLLANGVTLVDLLGDLVDSCGAAHGHAGEDWPHAIIEMAAGSVGVHLHAVPPAAFQQATELMDMAVEAILSDLTTAAEIAGRRENGYRVPPTPRGGLL